MGSLAGHDGEACAVFHFKLRNLVLIIFQKFFQIRREEKPPLKDISKTKLLLYPI